MRISTLKVACISIVVMLWTGCAAERPGPDPNPKRLEGFFTPTGTKHFDIAAYPDIPATEVLYFDNDSDGYVAAIDYTTWRMAIYSYADSKRLFDLPIGDTLASQYGIADIYVNGFYVRNLDSIFVLLNPSNDIFLLNAKAEVKNRWTITEDRPSGRKYGLLTFYNQCPMLFKGDELIVSQQLMDGSFAQDTMVRRIKFESPADVRIRFSGGSYEIEEVGSFPYNFLKAFYYDVMGCRVANDNGDLVYSYGVNDSIHVVRNDGRVEAKYAKSNYVNGEFLPYDSEKYMDGEYRAKYWAEQPRYSHILFDKYRRLYYRFVAHAQEYKSNEGRVHLYQDKPWSIIVLDSNLKVVGEQVFPAKQYNFEQIMLAPDGLLVSYHELSPKAKKGTLAYQVFSIVPGQRKE